MQLHNLIAVVALGLSSQIAMAGEVNSLLRPAKGMSASLSRSWGDVAGTNPHRIGLNAGAMTVSASMGAAALSAADLGMFPSVSRSGDSLALPAAVIAGQSFLAQTSAASSNADPVGGNSGSASSDSEGYMTLLAGIGVVGFLAAKRRSAR